MLEARTLKAGIHTFRAIGHINPEATVYRDIPLIGTKKKLIESVGRHLAQADAELRNVLNILLERGEIGTKDIREIEDTQDELKKLFNMDREEAIRRLKEVLA